MQDEIVDLASTTDQHGGAKTTASGTPRTDAEQGYALGGALMVRPEFARQLERELNELREITELQIHNLRTFVDRALKILLQATPPDMPISKDDYNPISAWVYEAQQMLRMSEPQKAAIRTEVASSKAE